MANIKDIIPFILYFEAGLSRNYINLPLEDMFAKARKTGWANDPDDRGGATMCGITIGTYEGYCRKKGYPKPTNERLRNISSEQWLDVLKTLFWDKWKADEIISQPLANILVDWVWASGTNGIKIPQRILAKAFPDVKVDGIVGPKTLHALNSYAPREELFSLIHYARVNFIEDIIRRNPKQSKFRKGWLRRINAITFDGLIFN